MSGALLASGGGTRTKECGSQCNFYKFYSPEYPLSSEVPLYTIQVDNDNENVPDNRRTSSSEAPDQDDCMTVEELLEESKVWFPECDHDGESKPRDDSKLDYIEVDGEGCEIEVKSEIIDDISLSLLRRALSLTIAEATSARIQQAVSNERDSVPTVVEVDDGPPEEKPETSGFSPQTPSHKERFILPKSLLEDSPDDGTKRHKCPDCNRGFAQKSWLDRHSVVHTGLRPYSCSQCNSSFRRNYDLTKHLLTHTMFTLGPDGGHVCKVCSRTFDKRSHLISHLTSHSGGRPHPCHLCGYRFKTKKDLQRHLMIHAGEKPYSCSSCNYKSNQKYNVKKHMQKCHPLVEALPLEGPIPSLSSLAAMFLQ